MKQTNQKTFFQTLNSNKYYKERKKETNEFNIYAYIKFHIKILSR